MRRSFLDQRGVFRHQRRERVHQEIDRNRISGMWRRRQRAAFEDVAFSLGQQRPQHGEGRLHGSDDAGARWSDRGGGRIVSDLEDLGSAVEDRRVALDVKREYWRANHHD